MQVKKCRETDFKIVLQALIQLHLCVTEYFKWKSEYSTIRQNPNDCDIAIPNPS